MLWIKENLPLEFDYNEYSRLLGLVRTRQPNNKSNIIVINTSNTDLGQGVAHRDVFTLDEVNSPLINRVLELLDFAYIKFLLVFMVEPNIPVLPHVHKYPGEMESHYQTIVGLSPDNDIKGVRFEETNFDLTGHNHFLMNIKLNHCVATQSNPSMWFTSFGSRMK